MAHSVLTDLSRVRSDLLSTHRYFSTIGKVLRCIAANLIPSRLYFETHPVGQYPRIYPAYGILPRPIIVTQSETASKEQEQPVLPVNNKNSEPKLGLADMNFLNCKNVLYQATCDAR
jgi:hypothetical protein